MWLIIKNNSFKTGFTYVYVVYNRKSFIQYRCKPWFRLAVFAGEMDSYTEIESVLILEVVVDVEVTVIGRF